MANNSAKKNKANSEATAANAWPFFFGFQIAYALMLCYYGLYLDWSSLVWFSVYLYFERKLLQLVFVDLEAGRKPGWTLDLFGVLALSQILNIFSSTLSTGALLIVPGYLMYQYGGYIT
jgi:membrane protease YdiL (CAAX protease family)